MKHTGNVGPLKTTKEKHVLRVGFCCLNGDILKKKKTRGTQMGGRYDTEHMEEPRSWRPGGILWVHKGAQHAQAYIDRLSRCQRSKCRARYSEKRREPGLRRTGRAKHIIHQQRHQHSSYCKKKERSLSSVEVTMHYCMKVGNPSKRSPERSEWLKTREKKHLDQLAAR